MIGPRQHLALCSSLPIEVGSTGWLYDEWGALKHRSGGLGDGHPKTGPYQIFKGAGHDRLVSRRWLDWGPWRVLRGPNDTTLVQFHDIHADSATALGQALPGHKRLGGETGYIGQKSHYQFRHEVDALYRPEQRQLTVVVAGREVPRRELAEIRARQNFQALGPDKPIERLAYVFPVEAEAREHLHELWLHNVECWAIIDGREVRLDDGYNPAPPPKPAWVQRLEVADERGPEHPASPSKTGVLVASSPPYQPTFTETNIFDYPASALVLYAVEAEDQEPTPDSLRLVLGKWNKLGAEAAPQLTTECAEALLARLELEPHFRKRIKPYEDHVAADLLRSFLQTHKGKWVRYQLEPEAITHDGRARRLGRLALEGGIERKVVADDGRSADALQEAAKALAASLEVPAKPITEENFFACPATILVVYATRGESDEPTPKADRCVVGRWNGLKSDRAPYMTSERTEGLLHQLDTMLYEDEVLSDEEAEMLAPLRRWLKAHQGWWVHYQMEPEGLPHDSTARHLGLKAEQWQYENQKPK